MRIIRNYRHCPVEAKNSVITLGNFDGVHKGHAAIISKVKELAVQKGRPAALMTFEPHPIKVLRKDTPPFRITPFKDKAILLKKAGIDFLFVLPFNKRFSEITAQGFVKDILADALKINHVVIGHDFIFGHNREGNTAYLEKVSSKYGFTFTEMPQVSDGAERYSSTAIRKFIKEGNMDGAEKQLGHPFTIQGRVFRGEGRGNKLGFPTANLHLKDYVRPKFGVYICEIIIDGEPYKGVANIGVKPTFSGSKELLEAHIFNFSDNIYGKKIKVVLKHFLRLEYKFSGVDELKSQIATDTGTAKKFFGIS